MSTMEELQEKLTLKEADVEKAAEIGKTLLERNKELEQELIEVRNEMSCSLEKGKQDHYDLSRKIDMAKKIEQNYLDEIESLKADLKKQNAEQQNQLSAFEVAKIKSELTTQITALQTQLEKYQLTEAQLREKTHHLEQQVEEKQKQLDDKVNVLNETCSDEMARLYVEINTLQTEKAELTAESMDCQNTIQQLQLSENSLKTLVDDTQKELEDKQCEMTSLYNTIQKLKEENQDFKVELDTQKIQNSGHSKKGNSLFSELEDKRVTAEKKIISLRVENDSLKKQYNMVKQQMSKIKLQLATVLQTSSSEADSSHIERLELQLIDSNSEVKTLTHKITMLEQSKSQQTAQLIEIQKSFGGASKEQSFIDYLAVIIQCKDTEIEKKDKEIRIQRSLKTEESHKLIEVQQQLYAIETSLQKLKGRNLQMTIKIDELTNQLKIEKEKGDGSQSGQTENKENSKPIGSEQKLDLKPKVDRIRDNVKLGETSKDDCVKQTAQQPQQTKVPRRHNENCAQQ